MSASESSGNRDQQRLAAFESLALQLGVGAFEVDDTGGISSADLTTARMLGYTTQDELIGRSFADLFRDAELPGNIDKPEDVIGEVARGQESFPRTAVTRDGKTIPVLMDRFPLTSNGKCGYIALIRDISASEEIAEILRDDWLLPDIIDKLPIRVVHKDCEGKFTFANELFCQELGVRPGDVVGKTDFDLYSKTRASGYVSDDRSVLEDNRSFQTIEWHEPSGRRNAFPVQVVKTALRNRDNQVTGIRIFFWQLTDRERILLELVQAKESYLESLLEHLPLWIFRKDAELRFTYVSDRWCELIGKKREEVLRRTDFDIFPEHLAEKYASDDQHVLDTGEDFEDDEPNSAGGKNFMVHVLKTPIRNAGNHIVGLQGVFWDVTEIHDAMEQKTVLLRELHHRVKNNLASIIALINMQKASIGDSQAVNALQDCQNRLTAMELIHKQLLNSDDFARIEFGSYVDKLVGSVLETSTGNSTQLVHSTAIEETQVTLEFAVPCGLALNELVTNAVRHADFAESPGKLAVAAKSSADGTVRLSVSDNGRGMAREVCLESGIGLGIGLQLVRNIVTKQLKGKIRHNRPQAHFELEFPSFITRGNSPMEA